MYRTKLKLKYLINGTQYKSKCKNNFSQKLKMKYISRLMNSVHN